MIHKNTFDKFLSEANPKQMELVKQAMKDANFTIGLKQLNTTNVNQFAQWVLRKFDHEDQKLFDKYYKLFKKNRIIDTFTR